MLGGSPVPSEFPAAIIAKHVAVSVDGTEFLLAHDTKETESPNFQLHSWEDALRIPAERPHYFLGKVALGTMKSGGITIDAMIDSKTDQRRVQVSLKECNTKTVLGSLNEEGWVYNDSAIADGQIGVPSEGLLYQIREDYFASNLEISGGAGEIKMLRKPGKTIRLNGLVSKEPECENGRLTIANFAGTIFLPSDENVQFNIRTITGDVLGNVLHSGMIQSEIGNIAINCETGVSVGVQGKTEIYGMKKMYGHKTELRMSWYRTPQTPVQNVRLLSETGHIIVGTSDSPIPQANMALGCGYKQTRCKKYWNCL